MPHIVIKTIKGPSHEQLQEAAEQMVTIVKKTLGKPETYISVSVEEYAYDEWKDVFSECIDGKENLFVKPGYTLDDL